MKSISIYALTRKQNIEHLQKLEQQLSGREHTLKLKEWELESMRALVDQLELHMQDVPRFGCFILFRFHVWVKNLICYRSGKIRSSILN